MTTVYEIDPLRDERWGAFLESHRSSSIFHTNQWLQALERSYGHRAAAITTSPPNAHLTNGVVFCRVRSWATGQRLVSLPFSDHCAPLVESESEFEGLLSWLKHKCDPERQKYLEIRSTNAGTGGLSASTSFCLHTLDLRPSTRELWGALHESCIRRKITKSEREVIHEEGASEDLLRRYYRLTVLTRRRHKIPPQPLKWYRNLMACMGDKLKICLASVGGEPAAGILTLRHKDTMTYKYGCSDPRFHNLGPMQSLLWKAIEEAKNGGLQCFDLGRTEWSNEGLLTYKDRWGAARSTLTYLRYPTAASARRGSESATRLAKWFFNRTNDRVLTIAGRVLYRHID